MTDWRQGKMAKEKTGLSSAFKFLGERPIFNIMIGVTLGAVAKDFFSSLVNDIIMPIINLIWSVEEWKNWRIAAWGVELKVGELLENFLVFIVTAGVIYVAVKIIERSYRK